MQTRARVASTLLLAAVAAAAASVAAAALAPAAAGHALDAGPAAQPDLRLTGRRLLAQQQGGGQAGPQPDWLLSTGPAYYVAADFVDWNYAPSGLNLCSNEELTGDAAVWGADGLGVAFKKAQFREYTDRSFSKLKPRPASEAHTGLLGPVLRAAVGQVVTLVLRNNLNFSVNLEPAGVRADVAEGEAPDAAAALAPAVPPGGIFTYYWRIPASMGPGPLEPSAKLWLYRSTVDPVGHATAGLLGPMLISNSPEVNTGDVAAGQERDVITVLQVTNEGASPLYPANLAGRTAADLGLSEADLEESLLKHNMNGFIFCNMPRITLTQGERVRWHMASVGNEVDLHNLHIHGNTFLNLGHRSDGASMIPWTARSAVFSTDNAGTWLMHCHVGDHITAGMRDMYEVKRNPAMPPQGGVPPQGLGGATRTYYVQAEEVEWDYAPLGGDACTGTLTPWTEEQAVFTTATHINPGSKFLKARYVEYTDDTFTAKKERKGEEYLGLVGPILRAEVGDTIKVVFKNDLRFPTSMHPHGVAYTKASEGAPYADGSAGADRLDDRVPPGHTYTYVWQVPETSGPGPEDPSTIVWLYHSHANEVLDVYAGLAGGIVIGRRGALKPDLTGADVHREVLLFFSVVNEMDTLFSDINAQALGFRDAEAWAAIAGAAFARELEVSGQLARAQERLTAAQAVQEASSSPSTRRRFWLPSWRRRLQQGGDDGFMEPMQKHSINGFVYCNGPELAFTQGERVRIHLLVLGTEVDIHTPNFMGQSQQAGHSRRPALTLMPGAMHSVDIVMANPGTGVVQCRVADHVASGMRARFRVDPVPAVGLRQDGLAAAAPVRRYFVAAEAAAWDYTPLGRDACNNSSWGPEAAPYVQPSSSGLGSKVQKARYVQYSDASFSTPVPQPPAHGLLGPLLSVEVGQDLEVVFFNNLDFPVNFAPDGGLELLPAGAAQAAAEPVAPGRQKTYRYYVPESAGPAGGDLSSVAYAYTSSVDLVGHPAAGLVGVLHVGAKGTLKGSDSPVPAGVDAVVPLLFSVMDETASPLLRQNMEAAGLGAEAAMEADWGEFNLKHAINGFMYCNLPGLQAARGSTLRLLLLGMGSEVDMHSPVFTGQVLSGKSTAYQTAELMPTVTRVVDVRLEQAGSWPVYCAVHDHYTAGMRATLEVQ